MSKPLDCLIGAGLAPSPYAEAMDSKDVWEERANVMLKENVELRALLRAQPPEQNRLLRPRPTPTRRWMVDFAAAFQRRTGIVDPFRRDQVANIDLDTVFYCYEAGFIPEKAAEYYAFVAVRSLFERRP